MSKGYVFDPNHPPKYGSPQWRLYQYEMVKMNNRGHNYEYWNEEKHNKMLDNGWNLYVVTDKGPAYEQFATPSEYKAKEIVEKLRSENNFARIIAGYCQNVQHTKEFSVIYKPQKTKK